MGLTEEVMEMVNNLVVHFIKVNGEKLDQSQDFREDLTNETFLVLLEGYGGVKIDGRLYYAVQMAARRLGYTIACEESTDYDFDAENVSDRVMGNSGQNHEQEVEVEDFINESLSISEAKVVRGLMAGESQESIGEELGLSQQSVSMMLQEIRKKALQGGYNVN